MILADKIIELRKKNGWSQEELADQLGVSRQSVSKWESAQSMPDMNKILLMSQIFSVSTDYLLKDELEAPEATKEKTPSYEASGVALHKVSMEEASEFLEYRENASGRTAVGVLFCILSPILLIALTAASEYGKIALSEDASAGIGLCALILLIGSAVALFIINSGKGSRFDYMEKENLDTEYGVSGMVKDREAKYRQTYTMGLTIGVVLCVISSLPLFIGMALGKDGFFETMSVAVLLLLVAIGVMIIVKVSCVKGSYDILLEEGDYSRANKEQNSRFTGIHAIYWGLAIVIYMSWSFLTMDWHKTWIVWPIAGVGNILLNAILSMFKKGN